MNSRGQYGERVGWGVPSFTMPSSTTPPTPSAPPSEEKGAGLWTTVAIATGGIAAAMLVMRSLRKSYRTHQREIHTINRSPIYASSLSRWRNVTP